MWKRAHIAYIELGLDHGFVDEDTKILYQNFWQYLEDSNFRRRLTTEEDIKKANEVLTSIIENLQRVYSSSVGTPRTCNSS